ncbi:Fur family transcriptional regulator [Geobacter sulfurreducens subsp. ethanolicus]|uniref:Transcriptional repressor n=1 Tax=Geomobilimonas luticola TaxID=1114878 RepID=A0ABS5SAW0_9BACT|nr:MULTISPECIES: Fur family transcriptional regulator [Geobacteraceae]MBT0652491.1 transcriptional repressor [Geomobilimonas luticola]BEH08997.1 Fur family transcriptional regulator [Geobacter sulfurreducens subsp. ethanolicus]
MIIDWGVIIKREQFKKAIVKGLKERGMKLTPQRRTIVDILTLDNCHPSAMTIYRAAREKHPKISLSTVYSTLSLLKSLKLVRELEFEAMDNRYDMDTSNHLNLICTRCGRIEDFTDTAMIPPEIVEKLTGFKVHDVRFEYYGVCSKCAQ